MARLPKLSRDHMTLEQQRVYDDIAGGPRGGVRGPFHALLYSAPLADAAQKLGQYVRYDCSIPQKLRELAILITAYHWKAQYEWFAHETHARDAGLSDSVIEAIRQGEHPAFEDTAEAEIYEFCTELYDTKRISDATFAKIEARHGRVGAVELGGLIGYYNLIAITLNVGNIPVPGGVKPFAE
ncbi:carboxymuconolactone decarboxylase family protein [Alphaproteobacteria bacterium]|nr:carboxymuconolactone decarboxylase family protein [Alphaproteobacteria bacterium]